MIMTDNQDIVQKLVESGLDEKHALLIIDMACQAPAKASEIGKRLGLSRMDAYNSLKKLQERGLVKAIFGQTNPILWYDHKRSVQTNNQNQRNGFA